MSSRITSSAMTAAIFIRSAKSQPMELPLRRSTYPASARRTTVFMSADDGIYVGGLLTAAGKTLANRIARWDGTNWYTVGGGTMGGASSANRVLAIAGRGSDVFVGGTFTNVGGINVSNIARWDGANWWNMGVGFDSSVIVLAATAGAVYAGGNFTNAIDPFPFTVNHIAMWDG